MRKFKLEIVDGHQIAHLPDGPSLIDTGSPLSMAPPEILLQNLPVPITRLVGTDELAKTRILLDCVNGEYIQDPATLSGETFPLRPRLGVFEIALTFNDQEHHACLDTGAKLSYAAADAVTDLEPVGSEQDFYPLLGNFSVPVYELSVQVGSRTITGRFGVLPDSLSALMELAGLSGWILGSDFFRDRAIVLDLGYNRVVDVTRSLENRKQRTNATLHRDTMPMSFSSYYGNQFRDDLQRVTANAHQIHQHDEVTIQPRSISTENRIIRSWSEERMVLFGSALLLTVLVDQVCFTHFKEVYPQFRALTMYPKFRGDCPGGCSTNLHPLTVLRAIGRKPGYTLYDCDFPYDRLSEDFETVLRTEVFAFCENHLPSLDADLFLKRCRQALPVFLVWTLARQSQLHGTASSRA